jgi:DNA-binding transcriptional ArsR family regulator
MVNSDYIETIPGDDYIYLNRRNMLRVLKELRGCPLSVFLILATAETNSKVLPPNYLYSLSGYSGREVSKALKKLREMGLIEQRMAIPGSLGSKVKIPSELRWQVWERDNFTCKHCGKRQFLSVDHIHPESAGGQATLDNLQTLCRSCNSRKGARISEDE